MTLPASARATASHWRRPASVSGMSREPAKRRSRTHAVSPRRMTKSLSFPTTPPFYLDSLPVESALTRVDEAAGQRDRPGHEGLASAEPADATLELDELGEDDVGHRPNFFECGRIHGV